MYGPYRVIRNAAYPLRRKDTGTVLNLSKDGGALALATNTPVETPAASGIYYNELTVTEMTADHIFFIGNASDPQSNGALIPEPAFDSGVAQAGAAGNITLRSGAPATLPTLCEVEIVRGTGNAQMPRIGYSYDGGTKVLSVYPDWGTNPDNTSVYKVSKLEKTNQMAVNNDTTGPIFLQKLYDYNVKSGTIAAASTTSIIKTNLTGYGASQFIGAVFVCLGATNQGIARAITDYNTATGDITVSPAYASAPANGEECAVFGCIG